MRMATFPIPTLPLPNQTAYGILACVREHCASEEANPKPTHIASRQAFYLICLGHRQEICRYRARTALVRWYEIHQTATNSLRMRRRADCWRIVRRVQCSFDRWVQTAQQGVARVTMHTGQLALWLHQGNSKHCIVARGLQKWSKVAVSRRLRRGKLRRADQFRSRRVLHRTFFQLWLYTTDYRRYDRRCNHASEELRDPTNNAEYDKHSKRAAVDETCASVASFLSSFDGLSPVHAVADGQSG